jgi:thiol-disulfide isomerase/thioredoxin
LFVFTIMKKLVFVFAFTVVNLCYILASDTEKAPIGLNIGNKAPDIIELGVNGEVFKLSDLQGQVVLIDFWASWCGPCRKENPYLVSAYQQHKNKKFKSGNGFTIFSVSLDQTKDSWVATIENDKLEWPYHVSDLKGWYSKTAKLYKVNSIPNNFLIDGNGIIVAKNLKGPMINKVIDELE